MKIKLVVKVPNHKHADQSFDVDSNWSVLQLKKFLSDDYPSKPAVSDQKLIYSGHLLQDHQNLLQVFSPLSNNDAIVTIHLVCPAKTAEVSKADPSSPPKVSNDNPEGHDRLVSNGNQRQTNATSNNASNANVNIDSYSQSQAATAAALTSSILSQMNLSSPPNAMTYAPGVFANPLLANSYLPYATSALVAPAFSASPLNLSPEEANTLNQLYTRLLLSNQINGNAVPAFTSHLVNPLLMNGQLSQMMLLQDQQNVAAVANQQRSQPQQQQQPPAPQAAANYYEPDNNDWLEWLHWISRAVVFISIVYFHSSLARFLLVMIFSLFFYLYHSGVFTSRNNQQREATDSPRERAQRTQGAREADIEEREEHAVARDEGNAGEANAPDIADLRAPRRDVSHSTANESPIRDERSSSFRVLLLVVSSFLTSLIPEQPHFHLN